MKKFLATAAVIGLSLLAGSVYSADDKKPEAVKGVLIDIACGGKNMTKDDPEAAAAGHPKACAIKCAKGGYSIISGKVMLKLDDAGNAKAIEYLAKEDSTTKVVIEGVKDGETLKVTSISAAK